MPVDKAKIHLWMTFFGIFTFLIPFSILAQEDLERFYSVQADFRNIEKRTFHIEVDVSITNRTQNRLPELMWILYPNRFLETLPNLNDLNYRRIYTNGYSKGGLKIDSLKVDGQEIVQNLLPVSLKPFPENTLFTMKLDKPLAPNETRTFHFVTTLLVPKKYGSFGYYDDRLTMSGGWTPYLASYRNGNFYPTDQSPKAKWEVKIISNTSYVAGSEVVRNVAEKTFTRNNLGQFPIQLGKHLKDQTFEQGGFTLRTVVDERKPEKILKPLKAIFDPWANYVNELSIDESTKVKNISFVQAPLREMLAVDAQDISFFSDRAYKVIKGLHQFHNVPLIRLMFTQTLFPQILKKESDQDYYWISEVVSTQLTEDFLKTQHYKTRDARKIGIMRYFSFLPLIDQLVHTPQFAFFDVFYNFSYPYDPVRDEFTKFQHRRQFGKSVIAHMVDELGEEAVRDIVHAYIQSPNLTFSEVSENYTGKKLQERFAHWTDQRPVLNYRLRRIKSKKTTDGYNNSILIDKQSSKPIEEPVEIRVQEKNGKTQTVVWDSKETEYAFDVKTETKIKSVEVDPRQRLLETKLSDNRRPPYWKFVLTEFFAEYDFNAKQPLVFFQSQVRKRYGGQDRYNFGGFYQADSYGASLGYVRLFGRSLDTLRLSHGMGFQYGFSRLNSDDVFVDATPDEIIRVTDSGFLSTVTASYFFGNQLSYTNPMQGQYGGVAVTYGSAALGGNFNFYAVTASGSKIFMLHPSHLLAVRGIFGFSGPDSMPSQVQYRLGGITSMRGLGIGDERYIGRNLLLLSAEYRHFLVQDIDLNLGLFRVRDIQGALFTDAGRTTNTVQEKADREVFGPTSPSTSLVDVFEVNHFQTDAGYGLRFFVDYLGVSPAIIRFDLAQSISDQSQSFRLYFGVTQSF